ncbi:hypothetical protein CBR_g48793 [Chara braunii]|uniref:Magnesium transporter n=1 Tax=Chara braunii TaxID=69332 RepID=A0A388M3P2_CHABU|nr:hypothetical protein CBR_g48793 [Chara braunii]|eukprot:GBG89083.1 hypothetical protein CBR_g48793 [Chara braunii]
MAQLREYLHTAIPIPLMDAGVEVVDLQEYIAKIDREFKTTAVSSLIFSSLDQPTLTPLALPLLRKYRELLAQARTNMQKAQVRMQQQANRRRVPCPIRAGDRVRVSSEEFALEQDVSRKLLPKWFGPWTVTSVAGDEPDGPSFVIDIPEHLTVHPVFHASKLATYTPAKSDDLPGRRSQDPPSMDGHQEVDRVISDRKYGSKPRQYRVTFRACDPDDTRWISGADLTASAALIYAHYERQSAQGVAASVPKVALSSTMKPSRTAAGGSQIATAVLKPSGPALPDTVALAKKKMGARSWMVFDMNGNTMMLEADKYAIMHRVGIHARDLRILDPMLSYPSTILGRERAIVLNLEHIKAIVTAEEMLLRNPMDEHVIPVVAELRRRLPVNDAMHAAYAGAHGYDPSRQDHDGHEGATSPWKKVPGTDVVDGDVDIPPFEFRALEVILEAVCSFLDARSTELENQAMPALDELTSKISSLNLERVRKLKTLMTRLTARVQKVRDELEQLLDDDDDMAELFLTRKIQPGSPGASTGLHWAPTSPTIGSRLSIRASRASTVSMISHDDNDVEELEMILEAYFMQIEGTCNKLNALREYIDDTEDYINIQLDNHRNQLIQIELIMSTATCIVSVYSVVAGIFGMNLPNKWNEDPNAFNVVVITTAIVCFIMFIVMLGYFRFRRLIGM